ncbi:MAG: insulinase family protein [Planctomycetes bacterium]|nr:insulinase family protein [Planctomycetota bacterium]
MPLSAVVLIGLLGAGQAAPRFERLDNGLRVVIVEDHALPLVSVQLWYHAGSACDPPEHPGLCAVARAILEHRADATLTLRAAGVRFESHTERDACYFSTVLPPTLLERVLAIEAARMRPLTVTPEALQQAFDAVVRACAEAVDDPNYVVTQHVLASMFPDHPYQHPPGFVAQSLKDRSPDEVSQFLRRWFVPSNATLFVLGDVSTVKALDQIRRRFSELECLEPPRRPEAKRLKPGIIRVSMPDPRRAGVTVAWRTAPLGYFENAAIDVLMHRLCNTVDGPLAQRLAEIGCEPPRWQRHAWRDAGMLVLSVNPREGADLHDPRKIEALIAEELANAAREAPAEIKHNRARALAMREALNRTAAFADRAHELGACQAIAGDALLADFAVSRIASVAVANVWQAAAELTNARTVILRASTSSDKAGSASLRDSRRPTSRVSGEPRLPVEASRSQENVTTHNLDNDVSVAVYRMRGSGELAEVRTLLTMSRPPAKSLQTLLNTGSTQHSAKQIRDYLSYHGLDLSPLHHDSRSGLCSRGPTSHIAQMIELQAELLRYPTGDPAAELGEIRTVEILVTGDVDPAAAVTAARMAWGDWRASKAED